MPSYFCHQCNRAVLLHEGDFVCSICRSEFIEEIPQANRGASNNQSTSSQQMIPPNINAPAPPTPQEQEARAEAAGEADEYREQPPNMDEWLRAMFQVGQARHVPNNEPRNQRQEAPAPSPFHMFFNDRGNAQPGAPISLHVSLGPQGVVLRNGGTASRPGVQLNMPQGSLEDLLNGVMPDMFNQLLDQAGLVGLRVENTVRYTDEQISQYLPMTKVTQSHVDNGAQCTTCFDTFKLNDEVGVLDCAHIFHRPCIEPWLKTKHSCPVCRQAVDIGKWKKKHEEEAAAAQFNVLEDLD